MARLPQPGGDANNWGDILNEYLSQTHASDGSLKSNTVGPSQLIDSSISEAKLDAALAAKVNATGGGSGAVSSVAGRTGAVVLTKADVSLDNVDNTSDASKPVSSAVQTALNAKANLTDTRFTDQRTPVDNSVSTAKIQNGAVTTAKLADASVTDQKLSAGQANTGQVLSYDGTNMVWTTVSSTTVSDASTTTKGIVQLAGDLSGTAGAPVVSRVNGVAVSGTPSNGTVLTATSGSAASWQAPTGGSGTVTSANITDATATGRNVLTAADAAAARSAIGAGTSNLAIGTTSTTAKAGNYAPTKADVGLSNVDNTSDANKPISTATQTALNGKTTAVTANAGLWIGTQAQYDALGSYSATTLYAITN
ncbi:MAG: hypothetical protein WAR37_02085 [Candidatus Microsaccharimonas sp.]